MRRIVFLLCLLPFSCIALAAEVYRCTNAAGELMFSDSPCAPGHRQTQINVTPANVWNSDGLRAWSGSGSRSSGTAPGDQSASSAGQPIDGQACENAKRDYEFTAGYKFAKPGESSQKRRVYEAACGLSSTSTSQGMAGRSLPAPMPAPTSTTSCDATGCWDNLGGRYNKGAGNTYIGPSGACQRVGSMMHCP